MTENVKYLFYFLNLCLKQNCVRCQAAWEKDHKNLCFKIKFHKKVTFRLHLSEGQSGLKSNKKPLLITSLMM